MLNSHPTLPLYVFELEHETFISLSPKLLIEPEFKKTLFKNGIVNSKVAPSFIELSNEELELFKVKAFNTDKFAVNNLLVLNETLLILKY
ncbi:hypothetical protein J6P68_05800 [bacterium]|nr:hypothetical protein [bacterium]MBO6022298.1 hypothetical protein [bacterium]